MRFLTAGESHGPALFAIVEGLPAGLPLTEEDLLPWLARRQGGYGRGRRMQIEKDRARIQSGVRAGRTTGAPLTLVIENQDYRNWREIMDPSPGGEPRKRALTAARPGHADLPGGIKYGHKDLRDVLERASARETAARVAVGAVAARLLAEFGVESASFVVELGGIRAERPFAWEEKERIYQSPLYTPDPETEARMIAAIDAARVRGDTLGGVVEVRVRGLVPGLGSHVHYDRKLDGRLAQAVMSVPAIKGVEIGLGFEAARRPGSEVHDPIYWEATRGYYRRTNRAGGLEGGITNGEELVLRAAMKPIATLMRPLPTVDVVTKAPADAARERSDVTAVPAAGVVVEAMVLITLAQAYLEKFGGDTLEELKERLARYRRRVLEY